MKPTAVIKWETLYHTINFDWDQIFCIPIKCIRDSKLQSLQYQILHRFYPTNALLHKWYNHLDENCLLCNKKDTIEHHFHTCHESEQFWDTFSDWWSELTTVYIPLTLFDVIFGVLNGHNDTLIDCLNYLILLAKWFISNQK